MQGAEMFRWGSADVCCVDTCTGPFDAVLGFSQGAAAAALVATAWNLRCCITAGGYVPHTHPMAEQLLAGCHKIGALHAAGAKDTLVTTTQSHELSSCFDSRYTTVHEHDGGHAVPSSEEFRAAVVALLRGDSQPVARAESTPEPEQDGSAQAAGGARVQRVAKLSRGDGSDAVAGVGKGRASGLAMMTELTDEEVEDELEAIQSIYEDEYVDERDETLLPYLLRRISLGSEKSRTLLPVVWILTYIFNQTRTSMAPDTYLLGGVGMWRSPSA